jgi:hypothetical protein
MPATSSPIALLGVNSVCSLILPDLNGTLTLAVKEPFPVAGRLQDHRTICRAYVQHGSCSQTQTKPSLKPSSAKPEAVVLGSQCSTVTAKTVPLSNIPFVSVQSNQAHAANLRPRGTQSQLTINNIRENTAASRLNPTAIPQPSAPGAVEESPPASILVALEEMRTSRQISEGAIVMQNMDATICNSDLVAQMLRCLQSEDATSINSISNGLKCHFRYRGRLNGDLLLWIEPFTPGDTSAFTGGHLFIRGYVQRNLGFGTVKPSFYCRYRGRYISPILDAFMI